MGGNCDNSVKCTVGNLWEGGEAFVFKTQNDETVDCPFSAKNSQRRHWKPLKGLETLNGIGIINGRP